MIMSRFPEKKNFFYHINPGRSPLFMNNELACSIIYSTAAFLKFISKISELGSGPRNNVGPNTRERFLAVIRFVASNCFTLKKIILLKYG